MHALHKAFLLNLWTITETTVSVFRANSIIQGERMCLAWPGQKSRSLAHFPRRKFLTMPKTEQTSLPHTSLAMLLLSSKN